MQQGVMQPGMMQPQAAAMPRQQQQQQPSMSASPQAQMGLNAQTTGFQAPSQPFGQQQQPAAPPVPLIPAQFQSQFQLQQQHSVPQRSSPFSASAPLGAPPVTAPAPAPAPAPVSAPTQIPLNTGFAEMASSFQASGVPKARGRRAEKATKIPNIRLSFITAQNQTQFEGLFKAAVGETSTTMSGEKAREILLRSRLDGDSLSHIWTLADTTRSGQLHFPEFALAMYLCNLKMTGKTLPSTLPSNIQNEVSSLVDIINFSIAEGDGASKSSANAPEFTRTNTATPPAILQPQPQQSNSQLLQAQMTGFPGQPTGFQPPQAGGLQPQPAAGFGVMQQNPQPTGYAGPRPPMPPMPTGYGGGLSPSSAAGGVMAPLNAQPTGIPGQWGLVNAPSTGLPNLGALQSRMMPQQAGQSNYTTAGLQGNAEIPFAITKDEKAIYDQIFKAWDGLTKGYIGGGQAIEIFGQSGLDKSDLERVWTLADNGNKGRLNLDEFAVAMHLIYRKLNGYPVPNRLPPELVPPSTRNLNQALGTMKAMLHQESDFRKNSGAALLPQQTGVSYLKSHSFRGATGGVGSARKDATVFKNDDDQIGYRSSARRRMGGSSPRPESPASVASTEELSLEQLKKKIREKQVLLDAMDFTDEQHAEEDEMLDRRDRREAEELYRRIRRIQEDIDNHPDAVEITGDSSAERRSLKRQLQKLSDKIPSLASQVRNTEKAIADARMELFRLKNAKAHPGSTSSLVGTGPGGIITEADRLKARAKAMMLQRTAALTGKKIDSGSDDLAAQKHIEEENLKIRTEKENNESMVRDVEDSVREFSHRIEDNLKEGNESASNEHEKRRWEDALGVEDEVRDFIFDLQRASRSARLRAQERRGDGRTSVERPVAVEAALTRTESPAAAAPASQTSTPSAVAGSYSSYKTHEERAAFIKQQAEQRMAERLAALGIKPPSKPGETPAQRAERERAEKAAKLRQAEEEDAKREAERQARLAEEQAPPPPVPEPPARPVSKKPPPPPSRKTGSKNDATEREAAARRAEEEAAKKAEEEKLAREEEEKRQEAEKVE